VCVTGEHLKLETVIWGRTLSQSVRIYVSSGARGGAGCISTLLNRAGPHLRWGTDCAGPPPELLGSIILYSKRMLGF
jgi:hypothetical protein